MRKLAVVFFSLFFFSVSCNCNSYNSNNLPATNPAFVGVPNAALRLNVRKNDRTFMAYITERTVSVSYDCTPKKGVVIVGMNNPKTGFDSRGTGVIASSYTDRSYIFTAAHVVEDIKARYKKGFDCKIYVTLNKHLGDKSKRIEAKVLAENEPRDIAILKISKNLGVFSKLELEPFTGEPVWAVGYPTQKSAPWKKKLSITKGVLATTDVPSERNVGKYGYYHRVTSQVYLGSSGGGIWTREGNLTGIVAVLYTHTEKGPPYEGYYYVKPMNEFVHLLQDEWKYEEVFESKR